ncbi:MAG TPA: bifunctional 4-hydroxy-2-oxoglutarate aldolase/2-dehydro-3-deoxy-phosphogluconate aldolase [Terriglobales bacterium]
MTKDQVRRQILEVGIVPVIRASSVQKAIAAAEAVLKGGISVVEITMTVPRAKEAIVELSKNRDLLVGAGTVLTAAAARECLDAGAHFLVSPGFDLETVKLAKSEGYLMMAGALTPTEVIAAWSAGSDFVKIFPCSAVGGASYIKALKGPLPQIPMIPTGGVNLKTAADFLAAGSAALGVGGELILSSALESNNQSAITELAKQYVAIIKEVHAKKLVTA